MGDSDKPVKRQEILTKRVMWNILVRTNPYTLMGYMTRNFRWEQIMEITGIPFNRTDMVVLFILAILFIFGIRVVVSFFKRPEAPEELREENGIYEAGSRVTVTIDGMMCGMCEIHVKDAVRKAQPDAKDVTASHESGKVRFTLTKEEKISDLLSALHETIDPQGYRIIDMTGK